MQLYQFNTNPTCMDIRISNMKFTVVDMKICSIIPALSWYSWAHSSPCKVQWTANLS